jgi:hypothetical protein
MYIKVDHTVPEHDSPSQLQDTRFYLLKISVCVCVFDIHGAKELKIILLCM